jgi:hypothetical protein
VRYRNDNNDNKLSSPQRGPKSINSSRISESYAPNDFSITNLEGLKSYIEIRKNSDTSTWATSQNKS